MNASISRNKIFESVCPDLPRRIPYHPKEMGKLQNALLVAVPGDRLRDLARDDRFGALFDHRESDQYILGPSLVEKKVEAHWCLLYKKHLKGSVGVRFHLHDELLPKRCYIPSVYEVVAGIITHYLIADEWLFETPVRTSTKDSRGNIVCVGAGSYDFETSRGRYRGSGIYVFPWWPRGHGNIGCAIARKPKGKA